MSGYQRTADLKTTNRSAKRKPEAIYTTHEDEKPLFYKAMVDGVLSAAYVKDGKLIAHEPWESVNRQMYSGPYMVFNTKTNEALDRPRA
ncbi:MAG: hypothetical protein IJ001_03600 [Oscillospiraceae bacterium]|nr:hypothetical protein [Oscillospiraceae bacterium]